MYHVRHHAPPELSQTEISRDILRTLQAAGCGARKKISASSLGMWMCLTQQQQQQQQHSSVVEDYFGHWTEGLSGLLTSGATATTYQQWVELVVARLQTEHEKRLQESRQVLNNNRKLSLHRLYSVFKQVRSPFRGVKSHETHSSNLVA